MLLAAKSLGFFVLAAGIVYLIRPDFVRSNIIFWEKGKRLYWGGVIRIAFAVILLLAASQSRHVGLATGLGVVCLAAGVLVFALGPEKVKAMIGWWKDKPFWACRLLSLVTMAIGVLILYAV